MEKGRGKVNGTVRFSSPPLSDGDLRIDRVRRNMKVTSRAIRYYEELGLLPPLPRNEVAYRVIPASVLPRLKMIRQARSLGFSLNEIREILEVLDADGAVCPTTKEVIRRKRQILKRKIREMKELDRRLGEIQAQCESSFREARDICPAIMATPRTSNPKPTENGVILKKGGEEK